MHQIKERLMENPVIAAVKEEQALEAALKSECEVVFLLSSTVMNVKERVERIRQAGKVALVHMDLVEGLSNREIAVDALAQLCRPHGIISTRPSQVRRARHLGLVTVQRAFILDSMSISSLSGQIAVGKPDFIEILPGIMPRVTGEIARHVPVPVIAGGLIQHKEEVLDAIKAGAVAVSTTCQAVWEM